MKLLKFQADWCKPCSQLTKTMAEIKISVPVEYVNIESQIDQAKVFGVRSIPTMILVDDSGNEVRRSTGSISKEEVINFLGEYQ